MGRDLVVVLFLCLPPGIGEKTGKAFQNCGQTKNELVSDRLFCTQSKTEILNKKGI